MLALVAQSDARLTGNQEVEGLISARSSNILSWRLTMTYYFSHSPLLLFQEGQLSVSGERMCLSTG